MDPSYTLRINIKSYWVHSSLGEFSNPSTLNLMLYKLNYLKW